jgi:hypothetical protein
MRTFSALLIVLFGFAAQARAQPNPNCTTGLCLQQVACPSGQTTSVTGTIYTPNGTDPLPNVTVYIPNAPVDAFTPGVSCPVVGAPPSGSPIVGNITANDGTFTLFNVPVGSNIPLVIQSGRWRRQVTIPSTTACTNTTFSTRMPQNQTEGDIPKFAIATGQVDSVECVLLKVGVAQSEFTDPSGPGRINLYSGTAMTGAVLDAATPTQASLMENAATLNSYDVLMLPCQGTPNGDVVGGALGTQELSNFVGFANAGGRVYSSHYSYVWMYQNPPFNGVANWSVGQNVPNTLANGEIPATVDQSFTEGQDLAQWLQLPVIGASTTLGQIGVSTIKHDLNGVIPPTQSWLTLNTALGNDAAPVMQFVFDTPIPPVGTTVNQCGRVLFNEYHVEAANTAPGTTFPNECSISTPMTPQEKLLEYSLFNLTGEGGQPSLAPTSQDFGSEAITFTTAPQIFTWTNNSSFPSQVTAALPSGDFVVSSNNCSAVAAGTSCQIGVVFRPTALGARTGTLTVASTGNTLTAALTGTGVPGFTISTTALSFGSQDVGFAAAQTLTLMNIAPQALPVPAFVTTGDYAVSTAACGGSLAAGANCLVKVTFQPVATGPRNGTVGVNSTSLLYNGLSATLTGNGVDFSLSLNPTSGTVVAGDSVTSTATLSPIAGFAAPVTLSCMLAAAAVASTCALPANSVTPTATVTTAISISTTSQFTVVGYGVGGHGYLWLIALGSGWLLWAKRRSAGALGWSGLIVVLLAMMSLSMTGCSGKLPTQNPAYTGPGNYTVTLSATDGFLVHTATYNLTVTAK